MTTTTISMPETTKVGRRAAQILARLRGDAEFPELRHSTLRHAGCWSIYLGYLLIAQWNSELDAPRLFDEAVKVLALEAAVHELTGDDVAARLRVSRPVDEMVCAAVGQAGLIRRIFGRLGVPFPHHTDHEPYGWNWGDYTLQCYTEAGWGVPPSRYWIDVRETLRRRLLLNDRFERIGIGRDGRSHGIDFAEPGTLAAKGRRIAGDERRALARDLAERYEAGATLRALAALTGRSYGSVHRLLGEAGVRLRPRSVRRLRQQA